MKVEKEQLKTISVGWANYTKKYESPTLTHRLLEIESQLLVESKTRKVKESGMVETWTEETVPETFTWEW